MDSPRLIRILGIALLALTITGCGSEQSEEAATGPVAADTSAPAWSGKTLLDDETVVFPEVLAGKPAVLLFWATWCPYCKAFMPYAGDIQRDYAEHGVQIITFNAKERGRGDPAAYIKNLGFPTVSIAAADAIAADYGVDYIPGLMVVDGKGDFVYQRGWTELPAGKAVAEQWDAEVRSALDATLALSASDS